MSSKTAIKPNHKFYEQKGLFDPVFVPKPKPKRVYKDFEDLDVYFIDDIFSVIINNVDKLKENKWYRIKSDEQREAIKDLMRAGFLPDVVLNDDHTQMKRKGTEIILKNITDAGFKKTK
jgi:hypothetical protein